MLPSISTYVADIDHDLHDPPAGAGRPSRVARRRQPDEQQSSPSTPGESSKPSKPGE
jgi:hypothetical protein